MAHFIGTAADFQNQKTSNRRLSATLPRPAAAATDLKALASCQSQRPEQPHQASE